MSWYDGLFEELSSFKDEAKAVYMSGYMKNKFEFLGVATPVRKDVCQKYFKKALAENLDYEFLGLCYDSDYREHQYVAVNYLEAVNEKLKSSDIKLIERLIISKSWWDTVDGLDKVAGLLAEKYPSLNKKMISWSLAENIWLRRAAIDHQLYRKEKTDLNILENIIVNNFGSSEFFINKAIGWALREYSKTNPVWVVDFISRYRDKLSKLSLREASKYI